MDYEVLKKVRQKIRKMIVIAVVKKTSIKNKIIKIENILRNN